VIKIDPGYIILEKTGEKIKEVEIKALSISREDYEKYNGDEVRGIIEIEAEKVHFGQYEMNPVVNINHDLSIPPVGKMIQRHSVTIGNGITTTIVVIKLIKQEA